MLDLEALLVTLYAARTSDTGFSRGLVISGVPVAYALVTVADERPCLAVVLVEDERVEEARAGALRLLIGGVRTVLLVDPRQARAWYGHDDEGALSPLLPGGVIEDASLCEPLPAEAVLNSAAARTWSGERLYERTRRGLVRRWRYEKETEAA